MTYEHIPLDKSNDNHYFIYSNYNDEGNPDSVGSSLFCSLKKMFNGKMISGDDLLGIIETEPMR